MIGYEYSKKKNDKTTNLRLILERREKHEQIVVQYEDNHEWILQEKWEKRLRDSFFFVEIFIDNQEK